MINLLRRAWDTLDTFKQAYPENWHDDDQQVLDDLMRADLDLSGVKRKAEKQEPVAVWELQDSGWETICDGDWLQTLPIGTRLYTHPPKREAEKQEPVMWVMPDGKTVDKWGLQFYGGQTGTPLYTHPLKREWVGLTDEEKAEIKKNNYWNIPHVPTLFDAIEAKLKEKNT